MFSVQNTVYWSQTCTFMCLGLFCLQEKKEGSNTFFNRLNRQSMASVVQKMHGIIWGVTWSKLPFFKFIIINWPNIKVLFFFQLLEKKIFTEIFEGLLEYVKQCSSNPETSHSEIPAATLLTGTDKFTVCRIILNLILLHLSSSLLFSFPYFFLN